MNKILIIGGNGYIGTKLHQYLSVDGDNNTTDKKIEINQ
jgi:nucleoside-diphosphate-sugar epimerase